MTSQGQTLASSSTTLRPLDNTHTAYIGMGANLGDARATLQQATADLAAGNNVASVELSSFYRSAPVDAGGPDYINAVARVRTELAPLQLLDRLQALELCHGRARPYHNAPRTLDLDLLFYDDLSMVHERLTLPHPRLHQRAFVLLPLLDLAHAGPETGVAATTATTAATALLPVPAARLQQWLEACGDQRIERLP